MEALQKTIDPTIDQTILVEQILTQAKKICLEHTRKYDYFIEKSGNNATEAEESATRQSSVKETTGKKK